MRLALVVIAITLSPLLNSASSNAADLVPLEDKDAGAFAMSGSSIPLISPETQRVISCENVPDSEVPDERTTTELASCFALNHPAFKFAYNAAIQYEPLLEGSISLKVTIAADGTVTDVKRIGKGMSDQSFSAFLIRQVKKFRWRAKPNAEEVTVVQKFTFSVK